jgi:hypothetical protein
MLDWNWDPGVSLESERHDWMLYLAMSEATSRTCPQLCLHVLFFFSFSFPSLHPSSIVSLYQFVRCNNIDTQTLAHEISFCSSLIHHRSLRRYHLIVIIDTSTLAQENVCSSSSRTLSKLIPPPLFFTLTLRILSSH